MAIHSSAIAWKVPRTEEPGRLQSMGSQRVGHDWVTSLHFTSKYLWRYLSRSYTCAGEGNGTPPTPVLLPGKSHGQRSLVGCSPWGREESDTTEWLHFHFDALEKEMATHFSVLAWRIPGTAEPGGLPSMGSHRVKHNWRNLVAAVAAAYLCIKKKSNGA